LPTISAILQPYLDQATDGFGSTQLIFLISRPSIYPGRKLIWHSK